MARHVCLLTGKVLVTGKVPVPAHFSSIASRALFREWKLELEERERRPVHILVPTWVGSKRNFAPLRSANARNANGGVYHCEKFEVRLMCATRIAHTAHVQLCNNVGQIRKFWRGLSLAGFALRRRRSRTHASHCLIPPQGGCPPLVSLTDECVSPPPPYSCTYYFVLTYSTYYKFRSRTSCQRPSVLTTAGAGRQLCAAAASPCDPLAVVVASGGSARHSLGTGWASRRKRRAPMV